MRRTAVSGLAAGLVVMVAVAAPADPGGAHAAVEAFVARIAGVEIRDLFVEQTLTLYHPDGVQPASKGEQRLMVKPPGRQRVEESIEGRREIRLVVGHRTWIRRDDGKTYELPPTVAAERNPAHLMVPLKRTAADLLAEVTDTVRLGARTVTVIGARAGDRQSAAVWLDPELGVVRFVGHETLPKGPAVIDLAFSDHRPLSGAFRFPHRQEAFVDGRLVLLVTVRTAIANANLNEKLFDPEALRHER
jgi:hypothetical protein